MVVLIAAEGITTSSAANRRRIIDFLVLFKPTIVSLRFFSLIIV
jgi:hypothetical protein